MLRFPNPGSTVENFVGVYAAAFSQLNGRTVTLDDMVSAVVSANLATSSGYMGEEAITRSTRADRSRDQLYNQLKMYAELFRTLGWLHPTPESALQFTFTLLGEQVVAAGRDFLPLLEECALGIVYPSPILSIKGDFQLRPFAFILRVMASLDGILSRDEMIVGPLNASSDRSESDLQRVLELIRKSMGSSSSIENALMSVSHARKIQVNTLHNYTRWPIAMLRDLGWAEKVTAFFSDGGRYGAWRLTKRGFEQADRVCGAIDIRLDDISSLNQDERSALATVAHYRMLERAGFITETVRSRLDDANKILAPVYGRWGVPGKEIIFSPFQAMTTADIGRAFTVKAAPVAVTHVVQDAKVYGRNSRSHLFVPPLMVKASGRQEDEISWLKDELNSLLNEYGSIEDAANAFVDNHAKDTQTTFYPLISSIFRLLGFKADHSRRGVNYQRWDACVWVGNYAIPIEIKSPTEEVVLSTKAVRQAMENKVILLARGGLETTRDLTSLVVGNRLPNERGEMSNLIDDVFSAFGFRLGVLDLYSLAVLSLRYLAEGVTIDGSQLSQLRGFIDV